MNVIMKQLISVSIWIIFYLPTFAQSGHPVVDGHGAIVRGDTSRKVIAIVFTGHEFADGGLLIRKALNTKNIKASFFFTGDFYANPAFAKLIRQLNKDGHYLGAHSNHHLLYNDWEKRDSTLVTMDEFKQDLQDNYRRMADHGIPKADAPYFLPPYEWYNAEIAEWTKQMNLTLINFSPGTRSSADYTYPEMGSRYLGSEEIYQSIIKYEALQGMNGFILLIHIGTDPRRKDKLYTRLGNLIDEMKAKGYAFQKVDDLLKE
jgi:endoglucanase